MASEVRAYSASTLIRCAEVKVQCELSEFLIFRAIGADGSDLQIVTRLQSASPSECNIRGAHHPILVSVLDSLPIDLS